MYIPRPLYAAYIHVYSIGKKKFQLFNKYKYSNIFRDEDEKEKEQNFNLKVSTPRQPPPPTTTTAKHNTTIPLLHKKT
jgi:hypothetical protein